MREVRAAAAWAISGSVVAAATLLAATLWYVPDQIVRAPQPLITVLRVLAVGTWLHVAALAIPSLLAVWLASRARWLAHVPRTLALLAVLLPPLLAWWLFDQRPGRVDPSTVLGVLVLVAGVGGFAVALGRRLAPLDGVGARMAIPASVLAALALPAVILDPGTRPAPAPTPGVAKAPAVSAPALEARPRVVLLLTVDTLRADHLGAYGYPRAVSPTFDRLAEEGTIFTDALAAASGTVPSFGAIHSGLPPECSGVVHQLSVLAPGAASIAERFQAAGFATLGVASNKNLDERRGFHQGFDAFDNVGNVDGPEVVARAVELWQTLPADKPVFAWVHLMDPHTPYLPPEADWKAFQGDALWSDEELPITQFGSWGGVNGARTFGGGIQVGSVSVGEVVARYDAEILGADRAVDTLLGWLRDTGRLDATSLLFTADHGETLVRTDRDIAFQHSLQVYQDCLHVPLVVWGAGVQPSRSAFPARHVDIAPTLLALAGLPPQADLPGVALLSPPAPSPVRLGRTAWWDAVSLELVPLERRSPSVAVLAGDWKLIVHPHGELGAVSGPFGWLDAWRNLLSGIWQDDQLFHLGSDGAEAVDRIAGEQARADEIRAHVTAELGLADPAVCDRSRSTEEIVMDAATREQLRELGYLD